MKYFLAISLILSSLWTCAAQDQTGAYKIGEFERNGGGGCNEYMRVEYLVEELKKYPGSKGLIVIYAGDKNEQFGNATAYPRGAKRWLSYMKAEDKIDFIVADGKNFFNEEFWIIPKGAQPPGIRTAAFDWSALTGKYHFSHTCFQCDPSYPLLTSYQPNFEDFTTILKENPRHRGLVTVYNYSDAETVIRRLTRENKLPRNRYRVRILKRNPDPEALSVSVDLFIIPGGS